MLYKVQAICKDRYVAPVMIRLYGERSELIIDRVRERKVLDALTTAKIGARVLGYFSNGRVESFIQGRALEAEDMIVPDICRKLGGRVGKLHLVDVPGVDKTPSCFKSESECNHVSLVLVGLSGHYLVPLPTFYDSYALFGPWALGNFDIDLVIYTEQGEPVRVREQVDVT